LLADKGYDADAIREALAKAEIEAVIPAKRNRKDPAPHDAEKYKWRNLIERLFNKLKNWRRIATRYDKTKESYLGFVTIAAVKSLCQAICDASHFLGGPSDQGLVSLASGHFVFWGVALLA
jgi:transposase